MYLISIYFDEKTERRLRDLIQHVGEIEWVSIGSFSSKVMYVQPVLSEYLHDMSAVLSQEFGKMEETIPSPYYQPFHWLPHCTIAKQLSKEQMQKAFQVLRNEFVKIGKN